MQRERTGSRPKAGKTKSKQIPDGRLRVVIENVEPEVDGGRFPAKRVVGEKMAVAADIFADGHDEISARLLYRSESDSAWKEAPMVPLVNDRWGGQFEIAELREYRYTITAWIDRFRSWRQAFAKKKEAGQHTALDLHAGADLIAEAAQRAQGADSIQLHEFAAMLVSHNQDASATALATDLAALMDKYQDRSRAVAYDRELRVSVDRPKAAFSTWYEMFPRSCSAQPGRHGTFRDCMARLPYVAAMGFDVLYFPPIHPIGRPYRKGKNNALEAEPHDVGSPWAIGSEDGGHTAIHPELGTLEDFRALVARAQDHGLEIALDIAFQCSADHPYLSEHPDWFRTRPDGTIQYAENPPKKYQDIYPLDFESESWCPLWTELRDVFLFWCEQGVRIFRVDNPHTKPFAFWQWVIGEIRKAYPQTLFLSEAFTRPKVMYRLAKLGFSQSYTYFAWRNTKWELTQYFSELARRDVRDFFRPNLWPNTPDILTEYLQSGGRPAFMIRLVLAATLGANYGIYGPAFELCENVAREPGSEEYLNSEKYEIKNWDLDHPESLSEFIGLVNRIRRENRALQSNGGLRFHPVDNEEIICFSKQSEDDDNLILVAVNLDWRYPQSGWVELSLPQLQLDPGRPFHVHDLLTGARYLWRGPRNYVQLDPRSVPAHIFRVARTFARENVDQLEQPGGA